LEPDRNWVEEIQRSLPELPRARYQRFMDEYKLPEHDATLLTSDKKLADYYEECVKVYKDTKTASNWTLNDLMALMSSSRQTIDEIKVTPAHFAGMMKLVDNGTISGKIAKTVYEEMFNTGKMADVIVKEKGLLQITDEGEIVRIVEQVMTDNPGPVQDYQDGKKRAMGFLIGQVMKATRGKANPQLVNKILSEKL
jgi:aspartyl-tRNA(Asn)/glutamyl-tRNA(Gln) amidotransferase subunit B